MRLSNGDEPEDGDFIPEAIIRVYRYEKDPSEEISPEDIENEDVNITHAEITIKRGEDE